ncbi:MAG: hypothetical protein LBT46_07170 [Planctomycetaceae bacterium]|nr:hypothetical protein [Planctomycetaceae bacterium]
MTKTIFRLESAGVNELEELSVSISERKKEIRRRRKRREEFAAMKVKLPKADKNLKGKIAEKLRKLSPGADALIKAWGLQ